MGARGVAAGGALVAAARVAGGALVAAALVAGAGCGGPSGWRTHVETHRAPLVADAALVFGCNSDDGGGMSPCLLHRMTYAVRLWKEGRFRLLVVSGGRTLPVWSSEARLMGDFARRAGVPAAAVVEEGRAQTTFDNLALSAPLLHERGARTVVLLSHPGHLPRIAWLAHGLGLDREFELSYEAVH